jgi:hypothetical protein
MLIPYVYRLKVIFKKNLKKVLSIELCNFNAEKKRSRKELFFSHTASLLKEEVSPNIQHLGPSQFNGSSAKRPLTVVNLQVART